MSTPPQLKILLVDDDEELLSTVADMLSLKEGLQVHSARSGHDALQQLGRERPDLMLVDIRMPGMNGWELVQTIRHRLPKLKIIMLTGSHSEDDVRSAFERGVDGYLLKPVRANLLYALIDNVINDVPLEEQFAQSRWNV